jgi:hypothetical protein
MLGAMVRVAQPQVVGARFFVGSCNDSLALLIPAAFIRGEIPPRSQSVSQKPQFYVQPSSEYHPISHAYHPFSLEYHQKTHRYHMDIDEYNLDITLI